jgi:hypothetical protein
MKAFWVDRYGEQEQPMTKKEWIAFDPDTDKRPFLVRLLASLKFSAKVKKNGAEVQVTGGTDF